MAKIKVNDLVMVIAGKDKGRTGTVMNVLDGGKRVKVQNVNLIKKHVRPNPQAGQEGGIVSREAALDISNVAVLNPTTNKADRVGYKILEDGRKVRYFKSNDEIIDA